MLFSARSVTRLAIPIFLQSVFNTTIALIDSVMVAGLGEAAVSGVALVGTLDTMLTTFFVSMSVGGTVVMSQYLGADEDRKAGETSKQLIYLVTVMATVIGVLGVIFRSQLLGLLFGRVETAVMENATRYFFLMGLSFPALAVGDACISSLRAMGDSATPLWVGVGANLINVGGNALAIYVWNWGVGGAAFASLVSRTLATAVLLWLLLRRGGRACPENLLRYRINLPILKEIVRIGGTNALGNCMFHIGRLLTQSMVSTLGTMSITANSVGLSIANYQYMVSGTIGNTAMIVVGRCIGAEEKGQAKQWARRLLFVSYVGMWLVAAISVVFARPIIGAWQLQGETLELTRELVVFHSIATAAVYPLAFVLPAIFRAASDVRLQTVVTIISMWVFRVGLCFVLLNWKVPIFGVEPGIMSVWIAMTIDWVFRTVIFTWRYLSGKWLLVYDRIKKETVDA